MASIIQFIRRGIFDDAATKAMGEAFDAACADLQGSSDLSDFVREIIARRIIEAAKKGERDPMRLCSIAIASIGGDRKTV
jgi:hypothetical protein